MDDDERELRPERREKGEKCTGRRGVLCRPVEHWEEDKRKRGEGKGERERSLGLWQEMMLKLMRHWMIEVQ